MIQRYILPKDIPHEDLFMFEQAVILCIFIAFLLLIIYSLVWYLGGKK